VFKIKNHNFYLGSDLFGSSTVALLLDDILRTTVPVHPAAGEMIVRKGATGVGYAVYKGLVNVRPHRKGLTEVVVLLERSESVEDLDHERAEEALARARQLKDEQGDDVDFSLFEGLIEKELNRVKIAKKYRARV
jgi:hypothetical protein